MKKILTGLLSYSIIAFIACTLMGMFGISVPDLIPQDVMKYRWNNGFLVSMVALPSICITGLLLGCAVHFGDVRAPYKIRFSSAIVSAFKTVMIVCVGLTLILSLAHDVFVPNMELRKVEMEQKPELIRQYLVLSRNYLSKSFKNYEYANLANFYAKRVQELDPKNEEAKELVRRSELSAADKANQQKEKNTSQSEKYNEPSLGLSTVAETVDLTEINKIHSSSVYELLLQAEKMFEERDYLGAHYYAQMAVKVADLKDVNLDRARDLANKAWNVLSEAQAEVLTEENKFFRRKVEGYTKLMAGDYLSAYYIFQTLANTKINYARDTDVKRYLNLSRYQLTQEYFFIDETTDKDTFESAENVYFSLHHGNGAYDIFYIKGITDVKQTGNMVRYLREVHIYSFDQYGDFEKSMVVPYAKMLSVSIDAISEEKIKELRINPEWESIPYLLLCSVDRDREDIRVYPVYSDKNGEKTEGSNQILLSMPYDDFGVISKCTNGISKLNMWSLNKMKRSADSYGYSNELIVQSMLRSVFYPFVIMFLLLLAAVVAWNYRLTNNNLFKFVWVFTLPFVNIILYGVVGYFDFSIKLMNFIFIGVAGVKGALFLGLAFYMLGVILMSVIFLARKGD